MNKIRVLIIDDSAIARGMISRCLAEETDIEVVATAFDPLIARDRILKFRPEVITLDIEMPRMDGLTFLDILREEYPLPAIVLSSVTKAGSDKALRALEHGAFDVMAKPAGLHALDELKTGLVEKIRAAARSKPPALPRRSSSIVFPHPPLPSGSGIFNRSLIVIGASTGGTEAIREILIRLPADMPPVCIVQHIPAHFSRSFADRLNQLCALNVSEAVDGQNLRAGMAVVAPGGMHMVVVRRGDTYGVNLNEAPPVRHQRPSVDVLFHSAQACGGRNIFAALLTGMGRDGADGMRQLFLEGACTVAQEESSCVVFGMPRAAIEAGGAGEVLDLPGIATRMIEWSRAREITDQTVVPNPFR
ncbi:MAG: chemotaxis response regulator protein-glutamate methylesterase [Verrucomicrobiae bacterium]|nr:chemotaxis response regulator protein-glutamate methylesterase [Verrucomicrobiae bacterium]